MPTRSLRRPAPPWPHVWLAAAVVVAVPLAMDPAAFFIFLPAKWMLATVLVGAGLAALLLARRAVPWSAPVAAWVGVLAVIVAAAIAGVGGLTSWIGYPGRYLGIVAWVTFLGAFVLGASVTERAHTALVAAAASGASILVSVYALGQEVGVDPIDWSAELDVSRTRSTLGNAAFLGAYLAMVVPLAARLAWSTAERPTARVVHAVAAALGTAALVTTETRGAWLGALAGVGVILVLERHRLRAAPALTALVAGAAVVVVVTLATVGPYASRLRSLADPSETTGRGRLVQWDRTLSMIADRPLLGWGPETYAFTFPRYIDAEFEREVGRDVLPDRAHNLFLDLASIAGGLGVAAYVVLVSSIVLAVRRDTARHPITVGLAAACVAYLVQLQFSFSVADVDTIFWLLAGLLVASVEVGSRTRVVSPGWAVIPVLVGLAAAVWGGSELAADRTLRRSLDAEASGSFAEARALAREAADRAPARAQYLQVAARLHGRVGEVTGSDDDFARALELVADARRLVPRDLELAMDAADLLLSWGEVAGDERRIAEAASAYEAILDRDPASSRAHLKLGVAYVQLDRRRQAEQVWRTAASLSPDSPGPLVNLGLLYEQQGRDDEARNALRAALRLDDTNAAARAALERLDS